MPAASRTKAAEEQPWHGWLELLSVAIAGLFLVFPGRWTPAAAGVMAAMWLLRWWRTGRLTRRTPLDWPLLGLCMMAVVGIAVSAYPAVSLNKFWGIFLGIAVYFAIVNGARSARRRWVVVMVLVALGVMVAMAALIGTNFPEGKIVDLSPVTRRLPVLLRGVPGSGIPQFGAIGVGAGMRLFSPNEVGGTLAMLLPLPLTLAWSLRVGWIWRAFLVAASLVMACTLVLTQSMSALIGLAAALLLLTRGWALLPISVAAVLALAASGQRAAAHFSEITASRLEVWQQSLAMLRDMPLTGIGLNTFPFILNRFYPGFTTTENLPHAHNLFLQTALDLGVPGLLAFLVLLVLTVKLVLRGTAGVRDAEQAVVRGAAAGLVAYLTFGLTDAITLGAKPGVAGWALLGLLVTLLETTGRSAVASSIPIASHR